MLRGPDPFEVLGISNGAGREEAEEAFRRLAKRHHPDAGGDRNRFEAISAAIDHIRRNVAAASAASHPNFQGGFEHAFTRVFESMHRASRRQEHVRAERLRVDREINLSLDEAHRGGSFRLDPKAILCSGCKGHGLVECSGPVACPGCGGAGAYRQGKGIVSVQTSCQDCSGTGAVTWAQCSACEGRGALDGRYGLVTVPRGVDTGFSISCPYRGGNRDLRVTVFVRNDHLRSRRGDDLFVDLTIPIWDAALGCDVPIAGLAGESLNLKIAAGTPSGKCLKAKGKGINRMDGGRGDLFVVLKVEIPDASSGPLQKAFRDLKSRFGS
ncbi:DnaJ C-terminal domain-containing protein [Bosea sp. ANAM02]|uniref:DnaJ C-terminal domain-containing protein n=1 Tax=Bosea sp. ANAM02 TaxID=2020412 RepID=UPI00140F0B0B|nr:DnaJ C-terminal domain-containing protein [Bosea sp. ANAM02]BCB22068.1 chaperone protein DnaJ [Bosea sp. ANAM02]